MSEDPSPAAELSRRSLFRFGGAGLLALAAQPLLAACGGGAGGSGAGATSSQLRVALSATLNPDPDVYFLLEGVMVTNAVYEGLVSLKPGTIDLVPVLASSWEIADDGLTYTFHLRDGITFADGSPIDSTAVQKAFERRTAVASSPSYMLAEVGSYATPDPQTFVVHLTAPVNNFMSRLASPWGPKVTNAAAIAPNAGSDLGQTWLKTNSAGSGPYVLTSVAADQQIIMKLNDHYWGSKPAFSQVIFPINSDAAAQRLAIERGDLDAVHDLGTVASTAIAKEGKLNVVPLRGFNMNMWQVNITSGPLARQDVRQALVQSLPIDTMIPEIYGTYATVAKQFIPAGRIPDQYAKVTRTYDPDALKRVVATLPAALKSQPVVVASGTIDNGEFAREATVMANTLQAAGLTPKLTKITDSEYFSYFGNPADAPALFVSSQPDDGEHPDNWFRLFLYSKGALSYGGIGTPESDGFMDAAEATPPSKGIDYEDYSKAADLLQQQVAIIPMADLPTVWVASKRLTGLTTQLAASQGLVIADLKPA